MLNTEPDNGLYSMSVLVPPPYMEGNESFITLEGHGINDLGVSIYFRLRSS